MNKKGAELAKYGDKLLMELVKAFKTEALEQYLKDKFLYLNY